MFMWSKSSRLQYAKARLQPQATLGLTAQTSATFQMFLHSLK